LIVHLYGKGERGEGGLIDWKLLLLLLLLLLVGLLGRCHERTLTKKVETTTKVMVVMICKAFVSKKCSSRVYREGMGPLRKTFIQLVVLLLRYSPGGEGRGGEGGGGGGGGGGEGGRG